MATSVAAPRQCGCALRLRFGWCMQTALVGETSAV
jgi:hypothetical protein